MDIDQVILFSYYPVFNWSSSEKKYVRRCLNGGVWSPSKPNFACEGNGKKKIISAYFIWYLKLFIGENSDGKNQSSTIISSINIGLNSRKIYGPCKQTVLI